MKILVCMKQVPQKDAPLKLNESGTWIRDDVSYEVNEPDAYALEEALRQKEKHTGEVVVITAGPARAQPRGPGTWRSIRPPPARSGACGIPADGRTTSCGPARWNRCSVS